MNIKNDPICTHAFGAILATDKISLVCAGNAVLVVPSLIFPPRRNLHDNFFLFPISCKDLSLLARGFKEQPFSQGSCFTKQCAALCATSAVNQDHPIVA